MDNMKYLCVILIAGILGKVLFRASVMIDVDLPPGVEITAYERHQDGHGFEVRWPLPKFCRCERCGLEDRAQIEYKTSPQAVRDLDVWGQPSFWIYQAPSHRCARCDYR